MRSNSKFYSEKLLQRLNCLYSSAYENFTCTLGSKYNHFEKRHRVIFLEYKGTEVGVCINFIKLSEEDIAEIYKTRWGIEVFFK